MQIMQTFVQNNDFHGSAIVIPEASKIVVFYFFSCKRLLADKIVELRYADKISHETVRRLLKKANLNLGKSRNG